ncbi:MAG: serine/threonine protein kinase [Sandaracinus sp.]|nr:serine/threonine protein kinase [Sandaracinus sp.]
MSTGTTAKTRAGGDPSVDETPALTPGPLVDAGSRVASEELATNRRRLITAYTIATILNPVFSATDFVHAFVWPGSIELGTALALRTVGTLFCGAVLWRLRSRPTLSEREIDLWLNVLPPVLIVMISLLALCIDGVGSTYTDAVNLAATAYAFVPRRFTRAIASGIVTVLALPATFLVAALFWDRARGELSEPRFAVELGIETGILAGTVVVLVSAAHALWALRREVFEARSIGRYRVERRLGRGGMGEVWSAFDGTLRRRVALKVMRLDADDVALARFEREVHATTELTHPNTVRVLDFGTTEDGLTYYAMELLEGETLAKLIEREGALDPARATHFALQAARALAEAHARGIVHRDVKPENLFVTWAGEEPDFLKVLDFGIARIDRADSGDSLTATGLVAGTPQYIAPEVIEGQDASARADVYALGMVVYQLLTGRFPYDATDGPALFLAHLTQEVAPPSRFAHVPADLEQVVIRCLAKRPEARFADARELLEALSRCDLAGRWRPTRTSAVTGVRAVDDEAAQTPAAIESSQR